MRFLFGLDHLIGLHIDVEFMAFARLVHDFYLTDTEPLLLIAFDFFDQARLGRNRRSRCMQWLHPGSAPWLTDLRRLPQHDPSGE